MSTKLQFKISKSLYVIFNSTYSPRLIPNTLRRLPLKAISMSMALTNPEQTAPKAFVFTSLNFDHVITFSTFLSLYSH